MTENEVRAALTSALGKRWKRQICCPDKTLGGTICEKLIQRVAPHCKPCDKTVAGIDLEHEILVTMDTFMKIKEELGGRTMVTGSDTIWSTFGIIALEDDEDPWWNPDMQILDCTDL